MMSRTRMFVAGTVLGLVVFAAPALAQVRPDVGVQGGGSIANVSFTTSDTDFAPDFKTRTRGVGGLYTGWDFRPNVGLQVDVLYSQRGAKLNFSFDDQGETTNADITVGLDYIEIPMLVRANAPMSDAGTFRVFGGPSLGFKVRDNFKQIVNGMDLSDEDVPVWSYYDFSVVAGAVVQVGKVFFDARYSWGLVDVLVEDADRVKGRTFAAMFGVVLN